MSAITPCATVPSVAATFPTHFVDAHFAPAQLFPDDPHFARDAAVAAVLFRAAQEPDAAGDGRQPADEEASRRSRWAERRRQ